MSIQVGSKAPNFTLKTKTPEGMQEVTLSNNFSKQQTVLLFVPLAFTPVCTRELCTASNHLNEYSALNANVYAISVDNPFAQEAWAKQAGIKLKILSDMNKSVVTAYDVIDSELLGLGGVAKRSIFVINKQGIVTYSWVADEPGTFPNLEPIKTALKAEATVTA